MLDLLKRQMTINDRITAPVDRGQTIDATRDEISGWGWLPALSLVAAFGLFLTVLAYNDARNGTNQQNAALRWVGVLVIFMPLAIRMYAVQVPRKERLGLVILMGLTLYLVKVLYSPLEFKFVDELQHWRATLNILQSNELFRENFILPVSARYPGLHNITTALIDLSGLSIYEAGVIVIGVSRLVLVIGLFHFYERIGNSAHIAGIAVMIYMTNPHFQFLLGVFSYQGMAIGPFALVLGVAAFWAHSDKMHYLRFKFILLASIPLVVVTHHITSYAMVGFMLGWTTLAVIMKRVNPTLHAYVPWVPLILTVLLVVLWAVQVAPMTLDYLEPSFKGAYEDLDHFFHPGEEREETYRPPSTPVFERLWNMLSVGMIASALPLGILFAWLRFNKTPLVMTLTLGSFAYFGSIGIRLVTAQGAELAGRSWVFVFIPVGFVISVAVIEIPKAWPFLRTGWILRTGAIIFIFIIFVGGMMGGWPTYWGRLPGPYRTAAFELSMEPQSRSAADWTLDHLGEHNRFAADFTNHLLIGSYGNQFSSYHLPGVFTSPIVTYENQEELHDQDIAYLLVDLRMSQNLPTRGFYFNSDEERAFIYDAPIALEALAKFDLLDGVSRIFDSGDIVIYDVAELSRRPPVLGRED